ncbi:phosphoribosyltransferase [Marivita hallyeonensis]|uniref:Putative phosphoribosyl transferase n=1 Tax=Marivita hallyeonensis TaxID=996342 RepID=A0A1M5R1B8_9RHOB|nr:phosphoribosyltransferase family protein [Marivita hallyeonensis]SHH19941.1 putative phosphoribosyl transferase [Marivita hallyeonensis]
MVVFLNRAHAGKALAEDIARRNYPDPVVLALPRGGVPLGAEVARRLNAPLDLVMVRKIGVPSRPELAAAAVVDGADPEIVLNEDVMRMAGLDRDDIDRLAQAQLEKIAQRRERYFKGRVRQEIAGKTAILVDDGIATGATTRAALAAVRRQKPARLVLAVPVGPDDTLRALKDEVDEVICLETPEFFNAVGAHYREFSQVSDEDVVRILQDLDSVSDGNGGT